MRIAIASILCATAAWFASAQPPTGAARDDGKLVIRPGGKGVETVKGGEATGGSDEKAGFIVIRPGGRGPLTGSTQVAEPKRPPTSQLPNPANPPAAGTLNVPPPGAVAKDAGDKDGKLIFDYWFAVAVDGQRIGFVNWSAKEMLDKNGKPFTVGVRYLNLTVSRFGQLVNQWGEESTVESGKGEVLITSMRQGLGKDQALALTGTVEGKNLKVKGEGQAAKARDTPWPAGVVGLVREPQLYKELNLKAGESFEYPSYIPTVNRVLKTAITLEAEETKAIWPNTQARKLLRFVTKPERLEKVKLPSSVTWVDAETFEPLQLQTDFPALGGQVTFVRTTKEAAAAPITKPIELFNAQSIRLDREILGIHGKGSVVYKVSIPREDEPDTVFATDARQVVKNLDPKAKTFELHVSARHGPEKNAVAEPAPGTEFTASNYFINWDNDLVKAHTKKALAGLPATANEWDRAVAIERWVRANMKAFEFSQAMATADNVAKTLSGDCTEYAMLAAAMCRATGIPSRTALGVVYAPGKDGRPFLAYHMWTEVYAEQQWLPIDATLAMGGVGPGHVKIADHSWHEETSIAPLLPVLRALTAKPVVEVLKVSP